MERTRLITARKKKHWTQEQAASHLGVSVITVCRWERGTIEPRAYSIERLCAVYGATEAELGLAQDSVISHDCQVVYEQSEVPTMPDSLFSSIRQNLTAQLMSIIVSWSRRNNEYHVLQGQINKAIDDYNDLVEQDDALVLSRRDALRGAILLPITACGLSVPIASSSATRNAEDILTYCAAGIATCWHVRKGKELPLVNDALSVYIPALQSLTQTQHKRAAATLLVQCFILKATLARHVETHDNSVSYLQQGVKYAEMSESALLRILSWRTLGATYYYMTSYVPAMQCFDKALSILQGAKGIPSLVHSYIHAGHATMQAQFGKESDALSSLSLAHKTFFAGSDEKPPIWVEHDLSNLLLNDGLTHYHLGMQKEALDSLTQMDRVPDKSEMIRVESLIERAKAEVCRGDQPRDMEYTILYWTQGIQDAKALRSEQWFTESRNAYAMLQAAWPAEPRIKQLKGLIEHW